MITATEAGGEKGLLYCEMPQAELYQMRLSRTQAPLWVFWGPAWAALEPPATTEQKLPHQELTEAGSTRQTSPLDTLAPCMPGRRDWTSSWLETYAKFSWFSSAKYCFRSCRGKEHFVESTETCFWKGEYCKQMSAWHNSTVPLCEFRYSEFLAWVQPLKHNGFSPVPCISTGLSLLLSLLSEGLSSCSALQLLPASASSLWPFGGYLGNPPFGKRLLKANGLHMINSSCRPQKTPPSWLTKVTESQKFMADTSNMLQPSSKRMK